MERHFNGGIEVLHFRSVGPHGETCLDPVLAELLFIARWRGLRLRLLPSSWPSSAVCGSLPAGLGAAFSGGRVRRAELLDAARSFICGNGDGEAALSCTDEAFCSLLRRTVGQAISGILYGDVGVWEDYTRPTLVRSAPIGCGWAIALAERRKRQCAEQPGRWHAALLELEGALGALADRLGSAETFGSTGMPGPPQAITALDACAYGHLSVLYSVPYEQGSRLHKVLTRFPSLPHLLDRLERRFRAWPDPRSFLVSLSTEERLPGAATELLLQTPSARTVQAEAEPLMWWEAWGWSWRGYAWGGSRGGRAKRPPPVRVREYEPPGWQAAAFGLAAAASVIAAVLLGCGPVRPEELLRTVRESLGAPRAPAEVSAEVPIAAAASPYEPGERSGGAGAAAAQAPVSAGQ